MVKKAIMVMAWFALTPIFLVLMLVNLQQFKPVDIETKLAKNNDLPSAVSPLADSESAQLRIASARPTSQVLSATVIADDARPWLLQEYLKSQNSPMAPFADLIVSQADLYGLDYRLLVAIAGCESTWGKHMPAHNSHNAFGIAVYTGQESGATFKDWPSAITWVSHYIKEKYYDAGITDLKKISAIWAPPSVDTGYSWANCVDGFIKEIN